MSKSKRQASLSDLTAEQADAIRHYANHAGVDWKRCLARDWMDAFSSKLSWLSQDEAALLQQVRNQHGPEWLEKTILDYAPVVGLGVTVQIGSDRYAGTIVKVSPSGHKFEFQRDRAKPTKNSNYYGTQRHIFVPDESAEIEVATRRKDGRYRLKGCDNYGTVYVGKRDAYTDPHF
jgi:hypothetical protein